MDSLMLTSEFKQIKAQSENAKETVVLLLTRCLKIQEACLDVRDALWKIILRKQLIKRIVDKLRANDTTDLVEAYQSLLWLSKDILGRIERVQYQEPSLRRAFVFDGERYDQRDGYMF